MCGFVGKFIFNDKIDRHELIVMRETLKHRGPDDAGIFVDDNVGLAFRRLSIIDLSQAGNQPMMNEEGNIIMVYNGEFYNFREFRQQLIKQGHRFRSQTDSEVIIHLYEQYGADCLTLINGMFALAIYDRKKGRLFIARDRFGQKPLYYYRDGHKLIFASELKAILQDRSIKREIDFLSLRQYLSFGYVAAPNTIFKKIHKLEPSTYLIFDTNKNRIIDKKNYWRLRININHNLTFDDWKEEFKLALKKSIASRMISDVPLGVFLSGGLDSSAITALMSELTAGRIKTFSIGFKEAGYDELRYSRRVAGKFKTEHYEYVVKPDAISLLPKLAWHFDEPFDDQSVIPTYYVAQLAKSEVTVVLTGDGGDELLAGYPRYGACRKRLAINKLLPQFLKYFIFNLGFRLYPEELRGKRFLYMLSRPAAEAYQIFIRNFNDWEINNLLTEPILAQVQQKSALTNYSLNHRDLITNLQYIDSQTYLPGDILTKLDRATMANSVEARSPFLDYRLWELVFSMPPDLRYRQGQGKYILKELIKDIFGAEFAYRDKMGFGLPLNKWFRGSLNSYTKEILFSDRFLARGFFDQQYIKKIYLIHQAGHRDFSRKIWSLLFFEHWCQNWLD